MANYAESVAIRAAFLRSLSDLEDSATQPMIRAYTNALERIEADIRKTLAADNPLGAALTQSFAGAEDTARVAVLRGRSEFIAAQFDRFVTDGSSAIRVLAPNAYRLGLDAATEQVGTVAARVTTPNRRAIEQAVARFLPGTAQAEWLAGFARDSTQQVMDDIISSTVLGENPNRVAMRVRKHGTMGTTRIRTFVHTETLGAARAGISDLYRDNSDILQGWIWNAEETAQTCEVCWAMNGTQHELSEDLDSHPNCRCVQEPMTKTWEQLADEFGDDFADVPETAARPFDPDERFRSVLSPDEQLKVLGAGKYALYRDGKIRLADLVTPTMSEKWGAGLRATTLRELRERGVESASVLDQIANAMPQAATQDIAAALQNVALDTINSVLSWGKVTKKREPLLRSAMQAVDRVHGVRQDIEWTDLWVKARTIFIEEKRGKAENGLGVFSSFGRIDGTNRGRPIQIQLFTSGTRSTGIYDVDATLVHEFGHFVDITVMPDMPLFSGVRPGGSFSAKHMLDNGIEPSDAYQRAYIDVMRALDDSPIRRYLEGCASPSHATYMLSAPEMFARAYMQWIAQRSGSERLLGLIREELAERDGVYQWAQGVGAWTDDEFTPIGEAMDRLFREAGMLL